MPMPTVVAVGTVTSGTAAITPALPTGWAANDIILLPVETENQVVTPPTGWAIATSGQVIVSTGTITRLTVLWRRAVAGMTAPTVTDPGDHAVGRTIAIRGCVTVGNPWNITASATETLSDTSVSCPGLTTTAPDCLIVNVFSTGTDVASTTHVSGWTNASLTSVTERMDNWVSAGLGGGIGMATGGKATAGAVSATTATIITANFKALFTIAMQGVAAGVTQALAASTTVTVTPAAQIVVRQAVAGIAAITATTTAQPLVGIGLAAATTVTVSTSVTLRADLTLAASTTATATATAALRVAQPLQGVTTGTVTGTAALGVSRPLAGSAQVNATTAGALVIRQPLAGATQAIVTSIGDLTVSRPMAASGTILATATADLRRAVPLASTSAVTVAPSADLTVTGQIALATAITVTAITTADLDVTVAPQTWQAVTTVTLTAAAGLRLAHALIGQTNLQAVPMAALVLRRAVAAASIITTTGRGTLTVTPFTSPVSPRMRAGSLHRRATGTRLGRTAAR